MLVVTDGNDTSDVISAHSAAVAKGINVFAVGVGEGNDDDYPPMLQLI
jgi:hypothetical protein